MAVSYTHLPAGGTVDKAVEQVVEGAGIILLPLPRPFFPSLQHPV